MTTGRDTPIKYGDLLSEGMSENVGTVRVSEFEFQLCDHVQKVGEEYYATAFYNGLKATGRDINGIYYKKMGDLPVALLPLSRLKSARAIYKDNGQTDAMLARAVKALESLNAKLIVPDAAGVKTADKAVA